MANNFRTFSAKDCNLSEIEILGNVPPEKLPEIEAKCSWREHPAGEVIIERSDTTTCVYFLVKGKVSVMSFIPENQNIALADLTDGETFGEMSAIDMEVRSARVVIAEPSLIAELDGQSFRELLSDCPPMALALLKRFSALIRTLTIRVTLLSTLSPHQRIYQELLRISTPDPSRPGGWIVLKTPAHAELASAAGTDKNIVAEAIGSLVGSALIERKHRSLLINDKARIEAMCR